MKNKILKGLVAGAILAISGIANAGLIVNVDNVGSNLVFSWSGSVNLDSTLGLQDSNRSFSTRYDRQSFFRIAGQDQSGLDDYNLFFTSIPNWDSIGTNVTLLSGTVAGEGLFFEQSSSPSSSTNQLWLSDGYISNSSIIGSMTFLNTNIASAGFNIGSYTWAWENQGVSDSLTLNVNSASSGGQGIPEPTTLAIFALGLLGITTRKLKK
ncbi:PEP-CTERM sorting domain-containing protein [Thalassotalea sp. M1531]|uniref:PEP-CTERM sorting domain-containing protein n=1 Tax=Thalassotalea algicola TaxID=2716224 RepID=A0A7Y0LEQ5_9GAMM|nr:PEP-CTERM sorting domain-containing protein [Thalassotalea algicola]NMP33165.1 PEP-CTERM sorting domain-containing protein [Thalassotalea algicola]